MKEKPAGNKYWAGLINPCLSDYDVELAANGVNTINKSGEKPFYSFGVYVTCYHHLSATGGQPQLQRRGLQPEPLLPFGCYFGFCVQFKLA